ncbi:hypothetical protein [Saccharibacillus qingshengii]|uniref:hypothetical protein n=1 Tax=Saccharibacillus qingshengii TaxID=1763540 RepID=UPI0015557A8A|nr:hypothetical protein [Saccharibacillus qingshengii]
MNKKIGIGAAVSLFMLGFIAIFYIHGASTGSPRHYAFHIETEDFAIRNIGWFTYGDSVYVDGSYYLESEKPDSTFDGISLVTRIDDEPLLSFAQADDPFQLPDAANGRYHMGDRGSIHKPGIAPGDNVHIWIQYNIDGMSKTYQQTVPVSQLQARPSTTAEVILVSSEE